MSPISQKDFDILFESSDDEEDTVMYDIESSSDKLECTVRSPFTRSRWNTNFLSSCQLGAGDPEVCKQLWTEIRTTRHEVQEVIADLDRHRHIGVTDDTLIELCPERIKLGPRLGHGLPTLRSKQHGWNLGGWGGPWRTTELETFKLRFGQHAPWLASFQFAEHGLVLAGGAVSGMLMSRNRHAFGDYDLFFVDPQHNEEGGDIITARERQAIDALGRHLAQYAVENPGAVIDVFRTQYCVTFRLQHPNHFMVDWETVQVVLRRYHSCAEVVYGFDQTTCGAVYDGQRVLLHQAAKLGLERMAMIPYMPSRSARYESRMRRYWHRGFDLVLPELDIATAFAHGPAEHHTHGYFVLDGLGLDPMLNCPCFMHAHDIVQGKKTVAVKNEDDGTKPGFAQGAYPISSQIYQFNAEQTERRNLKNWLLGQYDHMVTLVSCLSVPSVTQAIEQGPSIGDLETFSNALVGHVKLSQLDLESLVRLLGKPYAAALVIALIEDPSKLSVSLAEIRDMMIAERSDHMERFRHLRLNSTEHQTNLSLSSNSALSASEWYATYHRDCAV